MTRYILRRLLQAIPLLFIISLVLFLLMQSMGDPLATMGGRTATRSADRERLTRQLGLDKPVAVQYAIWLLGNDWLQALGEEVDERALTKGAFDFIAKPFSAKDLREVIRKAALSLGGKDPEQAGAGATPYLRLTALTVIAYLWSRMALVAQQQLAAGGGNDRNPPFALYILCNMLLY